MSEPTSAVEWQEAVDAANALLALDDARLYGLIAGGPEVDRDRCRQILQDGARVGFVPAADAVERLALELVEEGVVRA